MVRTEVAYHNKHVFKFTEKLFSVYFFINTLVACLFCDHWPGNGREFFCSMPNAPQSNTKAKCIILCLSFDAKD